MEVFEPVPVLSRYHTRIPLFISAPSSRLTALFTLTHCTRFLPKMPTSSRNEYSSLPSEEALWPGDDIQSLPKQSNTSRTRMLYPALCFLAGLSLLLGGILMGHSMGNNHHLIQERNMYEHSELEICTSSPPRDHINLESQN